MKTWRSVTQQTGENRRLFRLQTTLVICICSVCFLPAAFGADWPTYRGDSHRSGYTPEKLPTNLSLHWSYKARHGPSPAWSGRDTRMPFDLAYHTVVAGDNLYFGSSADCKVYALDASTGAERWTFFTGSPVRFAPALWKNRVFVVSDDGFLYCLAAKDGKLLWKFRGGPVDSMVLGNGRMISRWPARGGPAVADGVVYFAAGIWPSEGIFLYAVDAATGKQLWCNDTAGFMYMPQPHPGANAKSGISVQGNLVVNGEKLLIPTGRAVPAAFKRADGEFLYFHLQRYGKGKGGGSAIVASESCFFNGGFIFDPETGHLASKIGADTSTIAVTERQIIYPIAEEIIGLNRMKLWTFKEIIDRKGEKSIKPVLSVPLWRIKSPHKIDSLIVAGNSVIVETGNRVSVIDIKSKKTSFTTEVEGTPYGLAVANGRLFISTNKGIIYCYGPPQNKQGRIAEAQTDKLLPEDNELYAIAADQIIKQTGITEGYCLDLACGDGSLALALAKRTKLRIYAIDSDRVDVASARKKLDDAGLYGVRVTVHQGDPASTAYPNYFANLIVSGRSVSEGTSAVPIGEANRLLRPHGGTICIGKPGAPNKTIRGKLEGAGTWTHQYCDPANSNCSSDTLIKGPLGILWFNDFNFRMPDRHGRGPAPLFYDGWLFVEGVNGLRCVDAYNGRTIWEYELPGILKPYDQEHLNGAAVTGSNFCIGQNSLYIRVKNRCLRLDLTTGKKLAEFKAPLRPDGLTGKWGYIACEDGILYGSVLNEEHIFKWAYRRSDMSEMFSESLLFFALDAETGKLKWTYKPEHSIRNNAIAIGGGYVYLIDRPLAMVDQLERQVAKRRGQDIPEHPTGTLIKLDANNGNVVWKCSQDIYGTMLALSKKYNVLLMSYQKTSFRLNSEIGGAMAAFRTSDGKRLWDIEADYASRPILNDRTIYVQPGAWNLLTGQRKDFSFSRSYGCGTIAGSKNLMVFRSATLGYADLLHYQETENYGGIRPGCWINVLPVGGLVLMPDATDLCTCNYLIKSSIALQQYGIRAPEVLPDGGAFREPVTVQLSGDVKDTDIHYTLDGSTPRLSSKRYIEPIKLSKSTTLKARAFCRGMPPSPIKESSFIIDQSVVLLDGPDWSVYESPGGNPPESKWQVTDGVVTELSNYFKGDFENPDPAMERSGTLRIYTAGMDFADGELVLELASQNNNHGLGVAFRFQGPDRYYLWVMDRYRRFHILACKDGDSYRVLASNRQRYQHNHWYELRVVLKGPKITIYLDGVKDLEATDSTLQKGTFALYAWSCIGAKFRNVRWTPPLRGAGWKQLESNRCD